MVFNSFVFAAFFCIVYLLYVLTLRRLRLQNAMLLAASYLFYGWWDARFLSLLLISTLMDYGLARLMDRRVAPSGDGSAECHYSPRVRKGLLIFSLISNLGMLGFFKYYGFFAASLSEALASVGLPVSMRVLDVVLPVGISFYTFQTLSYTIDVYRGTLRAERSLVNFALFVALFPQLVAGPIVRASELLPQICRPRRLDYDDVCAGGYLVLWGLFKKVVIADNLAVLVDCVFAQPDDGLYGGAVVVAVYAFAVQIYCDFSGYTDIARGCAQLMGFRFPLNFSLPYLATNPVEFWRRWHITLSTWLRDYLYIPLGGNRRGPRRTAINLMLTMGLGGLWHGAAWTFVLWGVYQGLLLVTYRLLQGRLQWVLARLCPARARPWVAAAIFFQFVCAGWLIFRADSVSQIGSMLAAATTPWPWWILSGVNTVTGTGVITLLAYTLPLAIMQLAQHVSGDLNVILRLPAWVRGPAYAAMFYGIVLYGNQLGKAFVYFQF